MCDPSTRKDIPLESRVSAIPEYNNELKLIEFDTNKDSDRYITDQYETVLNQALQGVDGSVSIQNPTEYYTTNVDKRDKTKRKGARKSEKPIAQATVEIDGRTQTIDENLFDLTPSALIRRVCLLYTSPSPRDRQKSRMPSSA